MGLSYDIRLAIRGLRRAKGFAGVAILTLAVGIAGAATVFALVNGVLLRPLPVHDEDHLVVLRKDVPTSATTVWPFHRAELSLLQDSSRAFEGIAGFGYQDPGEQVVVEDGNADYVSIVRVTGGFFDVLGVRPLLGRSLTAQDDTPGTEPAIVLTHGLWQRRYAGSRDAIGRRLRLNGQAFTVVGVMPPDLQYPRGVEAWVTVAALASTVANPTFREAVLTELTLVGRLRAGMTSAQAATELRTLAPQLDKVAGATGQAGLVPVVHSFEESLVGDVRTSLAVLFAAAALVLGIAAANVANLSLLRGDERRREMAIRVALGANRARLVRQLIAESLVLALGAALVAVVAAWWMVPALVALTPDGLPRVESVRVDVRVVLFAWSGASAAAVLAGLVPALLSDQSQLIRHLGTGGRGFTPGVAQLGRRALVVAQVALAVAVVAAAGLLMRSVARLNETGTALAADRLVLVPLELPPETYTDRDRRLQFLTRAIEALEASPLVSSATPVNNVPFSGVGWGVPVFTTEGQSRERAATNPSLNLEAIHANYFETFEVPIVRGRPFSPADTRDTLPVAIVSEDVAARTWPGQDPIGRRLKMGMLDSPGPWLTVVGVTRPTRYRELTEPQATLYLPAEQMIVTAGTLALRTTADLAVLTPVVRERIRSIDPEVTVIRVEPFRDLLAQPLARPRFNAYLVGTFGGVALFLAAVGLYAVMAALVRMRWREIGVRMALGASAACVRAMVVGEGLRLTVLGAVLGLGISLAANRLLAGLLFGVSPLDPATLAGAAAVLAGAAALACYVPSRRATRVEPVIALRME